MTNSNHNLTGNGVADTLIGHMEALARIGDAQHQQEAYRWIKIIREHARPKRKYLRRPCQPIAPNFATGAEAPQQAQG